MGAERSSGKLGGLVVMVDSGVFGMDRTEDSCKLTFRQSSNGGAECCSADAPGPEIPHTKCAENKGLNVL